VLVVKMLISGGVCFIVTPRVIGVAGGSSIEDFGRIPTSGMIRLVNIGIDRQVAGLGGMGMCR